MEKFSKPPIIEKYGGVYVVRDDLYPGGTKARHMHKIFNDHDEIVYASPAEGGAQFALAACAKELGKRATIFVAKRKTPHPRAYEAKALGAKIYQVSPGYLAVVQARAKKYCADTGAYYLPFGAASKAAIEDISTAAASIEINPTSIWCAAGSGILTRSLCRAFPNTPVHAVQVGRALKKTEIGHASLHISKHAYSKHLASDAPFPICPHYEAKAWEFMMSMDDLGDRPLFWNVAGEAIAARMS